MKNFAYISIPGQCGICGKIEAFLGFAPARVLHQASFADILNEDTGEGYQRPRNRVHSRDFRQYITQPNSSTIPLTFNLRKSMGKSWKIKKEDSGRATLNLMRGQRCLAQVDCQHRLGELENEEVPLAFMAFIGLDLRTEMALFNIINSRAKGLSSSLTDYHESNLLANLVEEAPHLFISRRLNEEPSSPWHRLIRYGGETTSGLRRRTSLRMMQRSIQRFLRSTRDLDLGDANDKCEIIASYWRAIKRVFPQEWEDHRHHLLTKGVGLYSLMNLLAKLIRDTKGISPTEEYFVFRLNPLVGQVDWRSRGTFSNAGGQKGALEVYERLRELIDHK